VVAPRFVERARIVLACAGGAPNARVAAEVGVTVSTVRKWRGKFAAERLAGLEDAVRIGRPKADLVLSEAERDQLTRWAKRARTAQYLALRARIVLRCAEGGTNRQAAIGLGVDESTVERWRARFIAKRLDGLSDEPRVRRNAWRRSSSCPAVGTAPGRLRRWFRCWSVPVMPFTP
jgi:transposase